MVAAAARLLVISRNTLQGNAYSALTGDGDNMGRALVSLCRAAHHLYAEPINKDLSQNKTCRLVAAPG